jgi:hypothetical protein
MPGHYIPLGDLSSQSSPVKELRASLLVEKGSAAALMFVDPAYYLAKEHYSDIHVADSLPVLFSDMVCRAVTVGLEESTSTTPALRVRIC